MKYEVKIPAVGESITEATIGKWVKKNGEAVKANDVLLSLETDKASVEVVSEQAGVLVVAIAEGQTVPIGTVVGHIDSEAIATVTSVSSPVKTSSGTDAVFTTSIASTNPLQNTSLTQSIHPDLKDHLSPAVQRVVAERGLNPAQIVGSGRDGRLTKQDVVAAPTLAVAVSAPSKSQPTVSGSSLSGAEKRVPMTTIRKRIAENLVKAQHTAAILSTFNEVDMLRINEIRTKYKEKFKEKYGVSLGFNGFFVKAVVEALKAWPAVNASIDGTDIVYKNYYNVGIAVSTDKGLMVPVIKDADKKSVAQIEAQVAGFGAKAREGKISIDDLSGGTFSITNGGVFGSLMSTPILNYPQAGILGLHKIQERPVVVNKQIEIRPMMYIALSYDHRLIDGREAVSFLVRVKEGIEDPERLLIEV